MSEQERWTVGRLLQWTTDYLKKNGSASARLDAEVLLAEARGCQRIQLYTAFEEEPAETVRNRFRELVRRRAAGEPVAYLVGRREFYSLTFQVSPAVLIPRPETEFLVLAVLDAAQEVAAQRTPVRIADVGTGSGAIAISVAKHAPGCEIIAVDISPQALELARQNAAAHEVDQQIEFLESDLLNALPPDRQFDIIASNPPYVAENELPQMAVETREHEPRLALVSGPTGLEIISRLIEQAKERLSPRGWLMVEISPMIEAGARSLLEKAGFIEIRLVKDLAGLARTLIARRA